MVRNDTIPVSVIFQKETERAICVREEEDGEDIWLPLSQIEWDEEADRGDSITIVAPEWLLEDKGLL
jgi:hypothetical protein